MYDFTTEKSRVGEAMSESRKELESVLWAGADVLRSKMDANEYKDYLLSFVFYKSRLSAQLGS